MQEQQQRQQLYFSIPTLVQGITYYFIEFSMRFIYTIF